MCHQDLTVTHKSYSKGSSFQWSRGSEVSDASWFEGRTTFICNSDKNSQATSWTYSAAQATIAMLKVV